MYQINPRRSPLLILTLGSSYNDLNKSKIAGPAALQHPRGDHRRRLQQVRPQAQLRDLGVKGVQTTWQHGTKPKLMCHSGARYCILYLFDKRRNEAVKWKHELHVYEPVEARCCDIV